MFLNKFVDFENPIVLTYCDFQYVTSEIVVRILTGGEIFKSVVTP